MRSRLVNIAIVHVVRTMMTAAGAAGAALNLVNVRPSAVQRTPTNRHVRETAWFIGQGLAWDVLEATVVKSADRRATV